MATICNEDGLQIDICYSWEYFEVFGLSAEEFKELENYYHELEHGMSTELFHEAKDILMKDEVEE